jgi:hypothetical protein
LREASGLPAGYVPEHLLTADRVDRHGGELSAKEPIRGTQDKTQIFGRLLRCVSHDPFSCRPMKK